MNNTKAKLFANIGISILSALLTVLMVIPGNQGESAIQLAIEALKAIVGA